MQIAHPCGRTQIRHPDNHPSREWHSSSLIPLDTSVSMCLILNKCVYRFIMPSAKVCTLSSDGLDLLQEIKFWLELKGFMINVSWTCKGFFFPCCPMFCPCPCPELLGTYWQINQWHILWVYTAQSRKVTVCWKHRPSDMKMALEMSSALGVTANVWELHSGY